MTADAAVTWEVVDETAAGRPPEPQDDLQEVARRCRQRVAMVPLPGLDWLTDVGVLMKVLPQISAQFGLSPEQIERLAPERRIVVYKAISAGGAMVAGKIITKDLVLRVVKLVGVRLTAQQAAKYVPLAGQAVSAVLTFGALRYVCEQHIQQCLAVARLLQLPAPAGAG